MEADTINERFYSRTFSVIIDDEIIMEEEEEETFKGDEDDDDDRVSRARRRGKTTHNFLSLFRIGKRSFSLSLARSLF